MALENTDESTSEAQDPESAGARAVPVDQSALAPAEPFPAVGAPAREGEEPEAEEPEALPEEEAEVPSEEEYAEEEGGEAAEDEEGEEGAEEEERIGAEAEVEELSPTSRRIKGQVPEEKVRKIFSRYWGELSSSVQLPGFRKGRVPRRLLERRVGSRILDELTQGIKQAVISEVAKDHGLYVVSDPEFTRADLAENAPFEFEATCEVVPDFAIPPYEDIVIERRPVEIAESEIDAEIENLRHGAAQWAAVEDWPPKPGDQVIVTSSLRAGSRVIRRDEGKTLPVGVPGIYDLALPELPHRLLAGERDLTFDVQVPEDHQDQRLRARRVLAQIHVDEVKRKSLPEVDDAWAGIMKCASVAELRSKIAERLKAQRREIEELTLGRRALDEIVKRVAFPIPDKVKQRIEEQAKRATPEGAPEPAAPAEGAGAEAAAAAGAAGAADGAPADGGSAAAPATAIDPAELIEAFRRKVVIDRIAEANEIAVKDADIDEYLEAAHGAKGKARADLKRRLESQGLLDDIHRQLLTVRVQDFLRSKCRVLGEGGPSVPAPDAPSSPASGEAAGPAPLAEEPAAAGGPAPEEADADRSAAG